MITWTTEKRLIANIIPADYNPRKISDTDLLKLNESLDRFNVADPIILNSNNRIIGGHQRIKALAAKGVKEVDVRVPNRELSEAEEKELNLRLNRNSGEWDFDLLGAFGKDMLENVGFDSKELDRIFREPDKTEDDLPTAPCSGTVKEGDVYQLGTHRLMCGDSTKPEHVHMLMGGGRADMVFTDPPYNVNYEGKGEETSNTIKNDHMNESSFRAFLNDSFKNYRTFIKDEAPLYICYASRTHREFEDAINLNGMEVKAQIIWVKPVATMGWADYRWKHEPIFYARVKGQKNLFQGDRKQYMDPHYVEVIIKRWEEFTGNQAVRL